MEQNSAFFDKISTLRQRLPDWMEWTLLGVYIVSAGVGALFLSKLLFPEFKNWGTAFAIAIAIATQVVRLIVVFFDQLNPQRPALDMNKSYLAAMGLGGLAVYEAIELVSSLHLHNAVTISIAGLMAVGIVIELYVLRELQHATNYHFFSNPEATQQLIVFHQQQASYKQLMKQLKSQIATGKFIGNLPSTPPPSQPQPAQPVQPQTNTATISPAIWSALGKSYSLNESQLKTIDNAIHTEGLPESEIIKLIETYSALNKSNLHRTAQVMRQVNGSSDALDLTQSPNGHGAHDQ